MTAIPVEDWARREAEKHYPTSRFSSAESHRETQMLQGVMAHGTVHAFSALLSDEAVEAAASVMADSRDVGTTDCARRSLLAAVDAVTKEARND